MELPSTTAKMSDTEENVENDGISSLGKLLLRRTMVQPELPPEPKRKSRRKGKPGFNENMFEETKYYFKDGLRWVYPYPFTFTAYAKERWLDLTILQLFSKEFHLETMDYYKRAIASGKIKINNKPVSEDQGLKNGDLLNTLVHRHEPPVVHQDIEFLRNDDEMVVINKPASIPVHPCGRYRHNTIVFLLGKEHGLRNLHTIHRLDRLTSGVLMFSKSGAKAKQIEDQLHKKQCIQKEYFARVVGEFPAEEIVVDEPVMTASHKIGVCHVNKDGKPCETKFKRLSYNGKSSVVSCKPLQGRMHQIRVHLQWLGYPIVNDPIYNHPSAWGDVERKNDMSEVIAELLRTRKDKSYDDDYSTDKCEAETPTAKRRKIDGQSKEDGTDEKDTEIVDGKRLSYTSSDIGEEYVDSDCSDCKRIWKQPLISDMVMYLHSWHYKGPGWEYKTSIPAWAKEDWNID